jgi:lysophospholipase L1-like esterase
VLRLGLFVMTVELNLQEQSDEAQSKKIKLAPKNEIKTIVLLGDSTLDNKTWTGDKPCVTEHLERLFSEPNRPKVLNYAVDCFQTSDILNKKSNRGDSSMTVVFNHPHFEKGSPVNVLEKLSQTEDVSHIILSVGGNDLRNALQSIRSMNDLAGCAAELQKNYLEIIEEIRQRKPNAQLILMTQYAVDSTNDVYGIYALLKRLDPSKAPINTLTDLMGKIYAPIFAKAEECGLPIINMKKSLDHTDTRNFVSQIEPSSQASSVIASLIKNVIEEHNPEHTPLMWWHTGTGINSNFIQELIEPEEPDTTLSTQSYNFLLNLGSSIAGVASLASFAMAAVAIAGLITLSATGVGLVVGAGIVCAGLAAYGLFKANKPDENLSNPVIDDASVLRTI